MAYSVTSNEEGRLTIPAEVRAVLHIEGETHWSAEVVEGTLVLHPTPIISHEDAWAYAPEHLARVDRALQDVQAGRTIAVAGEELQHLAELPDDVLTEELEHLRQAARQGSARA